MDRPPIFGCQRQLYLQTVLALLALLTTQVHGAAVRAEEQAVAFSDAAQQGVFNVGAAQATPGTTADQATGNKILKLDYALPRGTAAGAWAREFPERLNANAIDVVWFGARVADAQQIRQLAGSVEIKGTAGTQQIPLRLQPGWTRRGAAVDWPAIGQVKEVVVLLRRSGEAESVSGSLEVELSFARLPWYHELSISPVTRIGGVLLASLLAAMVWTLAGSLHRRTVPAPAGFVRDLVKGAGVVASAALGIAIYVLGERGPLEAGWTALGIALAGAALAELMKFGLTGKHLTRGEVFLGMLAAGVPAASTSPLVLLQAPSTWSDVLLLSQTAAAVTAIIYHAANLVRLSASGRPLNPAAGALIVGTPYVVGGLLILRADRLVDALGDGATFGALSAWPAGAAFVGRLLVLCSFNVIVANGLSLVTRGTWLRSATTYLTLLLVAVAGIVAPIVAHIGSGSTVASWPSVLRSGAAVVTTMFSQAGLWAEVYLITGMILDAIYGRGPTTVAVTGSSMQGVTKGMIFSGLFMSILHGLSLIGQLEPVGELALSQPILVASLVGMLTFPFVKTVVESFDGSPSFFGRLGMSYRKPILCFRGAVLGFGLAYAFSLALADKPTAERVWFGFGVGALAFAGVNFLQDCLNTARDQGQIQSWRVYLMQTLLGGFVGAAVGFYLDAAQVTAVSDKAKLYLGFATPPQTYRVSPLLSKWGTINLGEVTGGVSLLFAESLAGVIEWSIPAWLFAINRTFLLAWFRQETAPIKGLFTAGGLVALTQNMIEVLRWGLWMSPIIKSFLRPMGEPTWYNQDGAIRTVIAIAQEVHLDHEAFRAWSLQVFIGLLAYDVVRVLIWLDHFGLRVATLVNLSFLGMDRLDERLARFLAPAATARCVPEAVKRFTTWAPLVIPYYIPRGTDWDYAWTRHEELARAAGPGLLAMLTALSLPLQLLLAAGALVTCTAFCSVSRWLKTRSGLPRRDRTLANAAYEVVLRDDGAVTSSVRERGYDVSRRSYDLLDPAGRALFIVDATDSPQAWPVVGNHPGFMAAARVSQDEDSLTITQTCAGLRTTIVMTLPDATDPVELWTVTVENLTDRVRSVKVVPYLEWVLNRPTADREHTQYNRLFAELEYVSGLQAILAWDKHAQAQGLLAVDRAPDGFLTARVDFLGRARSVWNPRVLETLAVTPAVDTAAHATLDPIGSLLVGLTIPPHGIVSVRFLIGLTRNRAQAATLIARHLQFPNLPPLPERVRMAYHPIGHGEIPPGTPLPYSEFLEDGRTLRIHTPFTPRPYDHTLANARGHVVTVTNRGLHTSASVNAQQNRLTPDWSDTVTREVPGEAFYLYDLDRREWYSPTYHPLNDATAAYEAEFGVDGTATFHMTRETLETELTVFVPPDEPAGVYLLTVRNRGGATRRLRLASYFQMVLAAQPEHAGPLKIRHDPAVPALFFENPRNNFRTGPAFVGIFPAAELVETQRGRFFGTGRGVAHPVLVEHGKPDLAPTGDDRPVAVFLTTLEIPAQGEATAVVVLGQADNRAQAEATLRRLLTPDAARAALAETRTWWLSLMDTVTVQTTNPDLDCYLDWLKYQALAERIWARRGFYQASGAFGFRDQLQDAVNLVWVDPVLTRRQILLHASQQFPEGDVVHWFHRLQDGRTGFCGRTHASDNLLWLAWAVVEYVGATGDDSVLEEHTPYLEAEQPFPPLPRGKHGMGFDPLRSSRSDTVYRHCLRSIDRVLDHRMGVHGLPLILTGDWNDGLDEIGSQGKGESIWLGFFLAYILERMAPIVERREGRGRKDHYLNRLVQLRAALERTWRGDRYLRAIHDDGTEIGVEGSGVWEIDALTAAWAVMAGMDPERSRLAFDTAVRILEKETTILLGWPPLREDTRPYLGRSSWYPEGVRENGMYCHGVQWLVGAARILAERCERVGAAAEAGRYRETAYRLWLKVSPLAHVTAAEIETYGGQPNKQAADMVTTFDPGRMIWNGYTGAAGWVFRQALEGVLGLRLRDEALIPPAELAEAGELRLLRAVRDVTRSPLANPARSRPAVGTVRTELVEQRTESRATTKRG